MSTVWIMRFEWRILHLPKAGSDYYATSRILMRGPSFRIEARIYFGHLREYYPVDVYRDCQEPLPSREGRDRPPLSVAAVSPLALDCGSSIRFYQLCLDQLPCQVSVS